MSNQEASKILREAENAMADEIKEAVPAAAGDKALIGILLVRDLIDEALVKFQALTPDESSLTTAQKHRLVGAGVKNYGFIDKAYDISRDNPDFLPRQFNPNEMHTLMMEFEQIRQLVFTVEQLLQLINDSLLTQGDKLYRLALRIYGTLHEMSRNNVPGAKPLFQALAKYFRKRKNTEGGEEEPTQKELERDYRRLVSGKADGEIKIVNERPHVSAGVREVIDDVHKGKAAFEESAEGSI